MPVITIEVTRMKRSSHTRKAPKTQPITRAYATVTLDLVTMPKTVQILAVGAVKTDSDADISVLPVSFIPQARLAKAKLEAAIKSIMNIYGLHTLQLQFNCKTKPLYELAKILYMQPEKSYFLRLITYHYYHNLTLFTTSCHSFPPLMTLNSEKPSVKAQYVTIYIQRGILYLRNPWASPIQMVLKKDGTWRICGDYRRLNTVTIPDKYPVKRLQDFTAILADTNIFSTLDMQKAYMQIPLVSEHRVKSAVITPFGLFEFNVITFGMRNVAQTFQRYADSALGDLPYLLIAIDMGEFCNKQADDQELAEILKDPLHPLKLVKFSWPINKQFFYANVQDNNIRPYLLKSLRTAICNTYHGLSHPTGRVNDRLIHRSYVWPNMTRDITNWCKFCLDSQQSKISRSSPTKRWLQVYIIHH
ncbi:uncharacterized protein LOC106648685 [Trichogramma pretiosum]|uniref:uncharacterized protein LOC106648685 n=1 Tax=Trichogramma pretiosum TaxID=7493 RepID=UPI0006C9D918|nr:uncharacterized protein LOC106648685 [Trichogramma pretiosum]